MQARPQVPVGRLQPVLAGGQLLSEPLVLLECLGEAASEPWEGDPAVGCGAF
jgi:hypothetical protein